MTLAILIMYVLSLASAVMELIFSPLLSTKFSSPLRGAGSLPPIQYSLVKCAPSFVLDVIVIILDLCIGYLLILSTPLPSNYRKVGRDIYSTLGMTPISGIPIHNIARYPRT